MEKSAKALHYFGLDCWLLDFSKRLAVCALHIQPAWRRSSMIRWIFV
jgi:hypothetical protein